MIMRNLNLSLKVIFPLPWGKLEKLKITLSASCLGLHSVRSLLNFFYCMESSVFKRLSLLLRNVGKINTVQAKL